MKDFFTLIIAIFLTGVAGMFISILLFEYPIVFFVWSGAYCIGTGLVFIKFGKKIYSNIKEVGAIAGIAVFTVIPLSIYDQKFKNLDKFEEAVLWIVFVSLIATAASIGKKKADKIEN